MSRTSGRRRWAGTGRASSSLPEEAARPRLGGTCMSEGTMSAISNPFSEEVHDVGR